ncbi:hypothetical protein B0H19DRAFT_854218, partial [Mycena capillaripes]
RPKELKVWISVAWGTRSTNPYNAGITDLNDYAVRWQTWWDSMQPAWRQREGEQRKIYKVDDKGWNWGNLAVQGPNGWLNVVAGLFFW